MTDIDVDYYQQYNADFLNRLCHVKYIPQSSVQGIAEEYLTNTKKNLDRQENILRGLEGKNIEHFEIDDLIKNVIEDDPFLKAQEMLNTEYKRTKFIEESDQFVKPCEILLNKAEA